jgi:hypothetical protein
VAKRNKSKARTLPSRSTSEIAISASAIIAGESFSVMNYLENVRLEDDFEDDELPVISGRGEGIMEEGPATSSGAGRRNEDIALDLMKFVAMTTGYGRTTSSGVGFQGSGSAAKPEEYAERLLELYTKCLSTIENAK